MWRVVLSDPLRVVALVSRYLTNKLIRREPLPARRLPRIGRLSRHALRRTAYAVLARVSPGCPPHKVRSLTCYAPVRHSTRVRRPGLVRLACVKHAASVRPEPGSNSPKRFRTAPDERLIVTNVRNLPLHVISRCRSFDHYRTAGRYTRVRDPHDSSRPWFSNNGRPPHDFVGERREQSIVAG